MLSGYRILDLCEPEAWLCGLVLAQLGADVVAVEPVGGWDCSGLRPYWREAFGRGRTALEGGAAEIAALARGSDAVLVTAGSAVDLDALRSANPGLVTAAITPWGLTGPKASWCAGDLVLAAAGGHVILNGDDDRPPVRVGEPQAFHHAATEAVVHVIAALMSRSSGSSAPLIDVAAQHCMLQASQSQLLSAAVAAVAPNRYGGGVRLADYRLRFVYPAADGHVAVTFLFGDMIGRYTQRLMSWVHEEGHCRDELRDLDYVRFFELMYGGELDPSLLDEASDAIARLTVTRTKAELLDEAMERNVLIAPISTTSDVLGFDQFEARGFWDEVGGRDGGSLRLPGRWAHADGTPLRALGRASMPGADNARFDDLRSRVPLVGGRTVEAEPSDRPLDGLMILDFSWAIAGPLATRLLADLGATVIRVETERHPDVIRASGPFLAGETGGDATALWHNTSAGKYCLELDITTEAGRSVVLDLATRADVVFESFSAGTLERLGLGHQVLSRANPRLVTVSSCLLGQTGPRAGFAGFGNLAAALAGFYEITGWPDRPPAGPFTAYTDYVAPRFAAAAILAAAVHAGQTGVGQYVDISQAEAAIHLLAPALIEQQLDAVTALRSGNRDRVLVPHGVYPAGTPGQDQWVAIACRDDAWPALVEEADLNPEWLSWDVDRRRAEEDTIDEALATWTSGQEPAAVADTLQARGIAAHAVQHSAEIVADPQLRHRGTPVEVPHPKYGSVWVEATQARWSHSQPAPRFAGSPVGYHTQYVLEELLGYDADKIAELVIAGAIG